MTSFEEARSIVLRLAQPTRAETVSLADAVGRRLVGTFTARQDSPAFDNSSVDGYAVRYAVEPSERRFTLVGTVAAGQTSGRGLAPGEAVRIFTGAPTPPATDAVVMQEDVTVDGDEIELMSPASPQLIRRRGEEYRVGASLLHPGSFIDPAVMGVLAGNGVSTISVHRRLKITLVVTGTEVRARGDRTGAEIHDVNGPVLREALRPFSDGEPVIVQIGDDPHETEVALREALDSSDIVVTTGGVSVGDHDLVRPTLERLSVTEHVWQVAVRPGKPFYYGTRGLVHVFGLPGNPLSAATTFLLFVQPALRARMGGSSDLRVSEIRSECKLPATGARADFIPGIYDGVSRRVRPLEGPGSHAISGIARADTLIMRPPHAKPAKKGSRVSTIPIRWDGQ